VVGIIIVIMSTLTLFLQFSLSNLIILALYALIGLGTTYAGYRALKAHKRAIIYLIIFNALQVFTFHIGSILYELVLGPYFQLDVVNGIISSGLVAEFQAGINGFPLEKKYFEVSLIHLAFLIYLLDQIRFIPEPKEMPWETEFTAPAQEKKVETKH
ncbi:MAG: hypothetical protein AAFY48_11035, partial [Bacteroidota bacterium]